MNNKIYFNRATNKPYEIRTSPYKPEASFYELTENFKKIEITIATGTVHFKRKKFKMIEMYQKNKGLL